MLWEKVMCNNVLAEWRKIKVKILRKTGEGSVLEMAGRWHMGNYDSLWLKDDWSIWIEKLTILFSKWCIGGEKGINFTNFIEYWGLYFIKGYTCSQ